MAAILKMYHSEIAQNGETTQEAFDRIYQFRGWVLVTAAAGFASDTLDKPVGNVEDLTTDELRQVIAASGGEVPPANVSKANAVKALNKAVSGGAAVVSIVGDTDVVLANGDVVTADEAAALEAEAAANPSKNKR